MKSRYVVMALGVLLPALGVSDSLELQKMKQMLDQLGDSAPAELREAYEALKSADTSGETRKLSEFSCEDDIAGVWKASNGSATVWLNSDGSGRSVQTWGEYTGTASFNWDASKSSLTFNYTTPLVTREGSTGKVINRPARDGSVSCEFGESYLEIGGVIYR